MQDAPDPPLRAELNDEVDQMSGSRAVEWVLLDHGSPNPVKVGDVVSADAGGMPIYLVVGLGDGEVLVGDEGHCAIHAVPLDRFQWKGAGGPSGS